MIADEVAVIDEIQLLRDPLRGWAWTRALLGIIADEVHVCGEAGAIDLVQSIMSTTDESVEVLLKRFKFKYPHNQLILPQYSRAGFQL